MAAGLLSAAIGTQNALLCFSGGMLLTVTGVWLGSDMARME